MKILYQILIIFLCCLFGEAVSAILPFSFPSAIIAMLLMAVLLFTRILKENQIIETADYLLKNMSFFFIPAGVVLVEHFSIISSLWLQFLVIGISVTVAVFFVTAWTVSLVLKIEERGERK